jgi:Ca2+-binding RTX toxin-like protein
MTHVAARPGMETEATDDFAVHSFDVIWVNPGITFMWGTDGDDVLTGGSGPHNITGGGGDDLLDASMCDASQLYGDTGKDHLIGSAGDDLLDGGADRDTMAGGTGNDTYVIDCRQDRIIESSGGGTDYVQSSVSLVLGKHLENLLLFGPDALDGTGNAADNVIVGNLASNHLSGAAGDDTLSGDAGDDMLSGGRGDDVLTGGLGHDILSGGAGSDLFRFSDVFESSADATRDRVTDFSEGQGDRLDLSAIDANTDLDGDQAFILVGTQSTFEGDATGQLRLAGSILYGSTDADTDAEFSIAVTGVTTLTEADLIL